MSDTPLRLRPIGEHAELVRERLARLPGTELVDDPEGAELVVMTPEDLAELIEDAEATAAYYRTLGQETVPHELVCRLLARENPVRVWREPIAATRCAGSSSAAGSVRLPVGDRERRAQRHGRHAEKDRRRARRRRSDLSAGLMDAPLIGRAP